jgi:hypothetical protein
MLFQIRIRPSFDKIDLIGKIFLTFLTIQFLSFGFGGAQSSDQKRPLTERFDRDIQDFAFIIPNLGPLAGSGGIKASDCGVCHKTIYQEWKKSTHANALIDIQFQSELTKPDSPKWLCLNCHIPVQNQRSYIVTHLLDNDIFRPVKITNPGFDAEMQQEGVTCAACHLRFDEETGDNYIIGPNGSQFSPHPVRENRNYLRTVCERCHNPQGERLTRNLICWFETTKELAEGQPLLKKTYGKEKDCVDCHMPEQRRLLAEDFKHLSPRQTNQHHWTGSGIPKWFDGYNNLLDRGYTSALHVQVFLEINAETSNEIRGEIQLKNDGAGHYLPSGDPERFILAIANLEDIHGKIVDQKKLRIGQIWEWNPARKISDTRLKQGEVFPWKVNFSVGNMSRELKLVITIYHVRLNSEIAKYIIAADGVDERLLENGPYIVKNTIDYYPFVNFIFKEEIDIKSKNRRIYSSEELIELSKKEQGKPLSSRDY